MPHLNPEELLTELGRAVELARAGLEAARTELAEAEAAYTDARRQLPEGIVEGVLAGLAEEQIWPVSQVSDALLTAARRGYEAGVRAAEAYGIAPARREEPCGNGPTVPPGPPTPEEVGLSLPENRARCTGCGGVFPKAPDGNPVPHRRGENDTRRCPGGTATADLKGRPIPAAHALCLECGWAIPTEGRNPPLLRCHTRAGYLDPSANKATLCPGSGAAGSSWNAR
jgi:hypothetical protein